MSTAAGEGGEVSVPPPWRANGQTSIPIQWMEQGMCEK